MLQAAEGDASWGQHMLSGLVKHQEQTRGHDRLILTVFGTTKPSDANFSATTTPNAVTALLPLGMTIYSLLSSLPLLPGLHLCPLVHITLLIGHSATRVPREEYSFSLWTYPITPTCVSLFQDVLEPDWDISWVVEVAILLWGVAELAQGYLCSLQGTQRAFS